ncbi:MAG: hypothetical protein WC699_02455 [Bacteroidales bacterium]
MKNSDDLSGTNPFYRPSWDEEGRGLSAMKMRKLPGLFNKDVASIKAIGSNNGSYIAFIAIKEGYARLDGNILVATENWTGLSNHDGFFGSNSKPTEASRDSNLLSAKVKIERPPHTGTKTAQIWSRKKLIKALAEFEVEPVIERYLKHDGIREMNPGTILNFTFGSSIYRAFSHETPTQRYKQWRWHQNPGDIIKGLDNIHSQQEYDQFAIDLGQSLIDDWGPSTDNRRPSRMNIGVAMKICNLVLKHMVFSSHKMDSPLIELLHVPWDSFTLRPLRAIYPGTPSIPANPGQGFVKDMNAYMDLHSLITAISAETGVARIVYEFWAWDSAH